MTLPNISIDKYIKFGYGSVNNKYRFYRNWVGPQTHIDVPVSTTTDTDANTIYLNTSG